MTMTLTENNFTEHFFDVRRQGPRKGQVMARFSAMADLVDDWVKCNMVTLLLKQKKGSESVCKIMANMIGATEKDSIRIPLEMATDLANGMTTQQVLEKPYRFKLEQYYWTTKECVPDNVHWSVIDILNKEQLDQFSSTKKS